MAINAVISSSRAIVANTAFLTRSQTNSPIELRNSGTSLTQNFVHSLLDVVEDQPQDGYTLVYNANNHKYEVKSIEFSKIDGGTF